MGMTKLDAYNYEIIPGIIRIHIDGTTDPDLVDIFSEIDTSEGRIYVEGRRYLYLGNYHIQPYNGKAYVDLDVVQVD